LLVRIFLNPDQVADLSYLTSGIGSNLRTKNILLVEVFLNLSRVSWDSSHRLVSSNPHAIAFPKYFAGRILSHLLNDISDKRTTQRPNRSFLL
jgi:hypothetical protein